MAWNPPTVDPEGHQLEYPNTRAGWTPCECEKATGSPTGHGYVQCLRPKCGWEWREGGCDKLSDGHLIDPPHSGTGNPGDRGYPGG